MNITERTSKDIDPNDINALTETVGWGRRSDTKWSEVLSKSTHVYSLWDQDLLIGFGRILEDGVMCMMYDIAVHPRFQNQGLGTKIMKHLIDQVKDKEYVSIGLFTWEASSKDLAHYYNKFGFEHVSSGMELTRYMKRE